jgi:hypothetical protein
VTGEIANVILISAGHHQGAQGASWNGRTEWPQAVLWQELLVQYLGDVGEAVPHGLLRDKVEYINSAQAVCAIEIHFNSAKVDGKHVGRGSETLCYPGSTKGIELAHCVQRVLAHDFPPDRGVKEGWYRMDRPGVVDYQGDVDGDESIDYILRKTNCPTIIIEPDFLHRWDLIEHNRAHACMGMARELIILLEHWGIL